MKEKENTPLWYPHYCNTTDISEHIDLMNDYFVEGLAVYFFVKEKLMVSKTGALPYDQLIKLLQFYYRWQYPEKLPEIINRCVELGLLDKDKGGLVSCKEIYERRGLVEKGKRTSSKGGSTSAENKVGGYSEHIFPLRNGKTWKLPIGILKEWHAKYNNVDELLEECKTAYRNNENSRDTIDDIKKHLEAYIIQNEHKIPF